MRTLLIAFVLTVLLSMLAVTVAASLDRGVFAAAAELWPDPWFRATLADAYFGFLTVYLWVLWRERSPAARAGWFVAFMLLGNIAIALYLLIAVLALGPGFSVPALLLGPGRLGTAR